MNDTAQREMEQRALRNVRGLVDKIERDDKVSRRSQRRIAVGIGLAAMVVAVLVAFGVVRTPTGRTVDLPPPKAAPAKP